tara:strand:+ start:163 stop:741 length:579 start_codon:yes stop_codon:yes gene_type:complete
MKNLIIISAPSGSGKTTLCRALQTKDASIQFSLSYTTRERRNGEEDGVDYRFVNNDTFKTGIDNGEFAEWEQIHGDYYYGTPTVTLQNAIEWQQLLLLELDVKGAMSVKKLYPNQAISIFVEPPSLEDLKIRLQNRATDSEARIAKRLERLESELAYKVHFDHHVINDSVDQAVNEILNIIQHENEGVYHGT